MTLEHVSEPQVVGKAQGERAAKNTAQVKVPERERERERNEATLDPLLAQSARRLWVATLTEPWRVLALVPVHDGLDVAPLGLGLQVVGNREAGVQVRLVDGTGADLPRATRLQADISEHLLLAGAKVVVVVDPPDVDPAAVPLALAADAVVLGVQPGRTTQADIERTVRHLGGRKVLGSVVFHEEGR